MDNTTIILLDALSNSRRRHALSVIARRNRELSVSDLATAVASAETGTRPSELTDGQRRRVLTGLHHSHLPKLERAGLVERDSDAETVAPGDLSVLEADAVAGVVRNPGSVSEAEERALAGVADRRRRHVVATLRGRERPLALERLARRVAAREREVSPTAVSDETAGDVAVSLHHGHLPKLAAAGFIEYDSEDRSVAYSGSSALDDELLTWALERSAADELVA